MQTLTETEGFTNMTKTAFFIATAIACTGIAFARDKTDDPPSIAIIGGADAPTDVFLSSKLARSVAPPDEFRQSAPAAGKNKPGPGKINPNATAERILSARIESEAEKYLKEHPGEFKPGEMPPGWIDNLGEAVKKAKPDRKPILVLFTGSDWCAPCQSLEKNVLVQPKFREFAGKHLVTVFLDSPRNKKLPDDVKKQNDALAEKFSIEAYPTVLILSPDGEKRLWIHTGYSALFLDRLRDALTMLDEAFPETAKAVKAEIEEEARAKAEARAAKEKAEQEALERRRRRLDEPVRRRIVTPIDLRGVSRPQPVEQQQPSDVVRPNPNPPPASDDQVYHIMPIGF